MVYKFFDKKVSGANTFATREWSETLATWNKFAGGVAKSEVIWKQELAEELCKPIIRKFEKWKVYQSFSIHLSLTIFWVGDLVDIQKKEICFLLCVPEIFSKYRLVFPLKEKNSITITNAFEKKIRWV